MLYKSQKYKETTTIQNLVQLLTLFFHSKSIKLYQYINITFCFLLSPSNRPENTHTYDTVFSAIRVYKFSKNVDIMLPCVHLLMFLNFLLSRLGQNIGRKSIFFSYSSSCRDEILVENE